MYKVVIADDEHIIRQGIVNLIDWKELDCAVVAEAENGRQAYEYVKEHSTDILVCDIKMPGMSGLEVAQKIQEEQIPVKVILLTAYSDFEYARQAIHYGVREYVVKTDYIESLPEIIQKVKKECDQTNRYNEAKEKLADSMYMLQEKLAMDLLHGTVVDKKEIEEQTSWCKFPLQPYYLVDFSFSIDEMQKIHENRREKTMRAVRRFVSMGLSEYHILTVLVKNTDFVALVFFDGDGEIHEKLFRNKLCEELKQLRVALNDTLHIEADICLGKKQIEISELHRVYESVHDTNARNCFLQQHGFTEEKNYSVETEPSNLDESVSRLLEYIEQGLYEKTRQEMEVCFQEMMTGKYGIRTIKSRAIDICYACRRKIEKQGGIINEAMLCKKKSDFPEYYVISQCQQVGNLKEFLDNALSTAAGMKSDKANQKYSSLVAECMEYIRLHFCERINIGTVAENLHVNKSYLGTVFKKETGVSIVEIIIRYRLEKAIELMQQTDYKLFEISEKVGFEDPAYFTNVFTKYMEINPKSYRSLKRK